MPPPAPLTLGATRSLSVQHNVSTILEHVYLGGNDISDDLYAMQELGVTAVLNCTADTPCYFEDQLQYLVLPLQDSGEEPIMQYFEEAFQFIDQVGAAGGRVLVHCNVGMSRSATIVIGYLMQNQGMRLLDAFRFCRERRPVTSPNQGFMGQLCRFEEHLFGSTTVDMRNYKDNRFIDVDQLRRK